MKDKICIVVIMTVIVTIIAGGIYLNHKTSDTAYNLAVDLIRNGSYESALTELENANRKLIDRKDFKTDVKHKRLDKAYKNTVPLYAYAMAQAKYNANDRIMYIVNEYLDLIPTEYNGELCDEIITFKGNFKQEYDEYLIEKKRQSEERMKIEQEREVEKLKSFVPYVGMSENQINSTSLGKYANLFHNTEIINGSAYTANIYEFKKGDNIVFRARCLLGKVSSISDLRDNPAKEWHTPKKNEKSKDSYNVDEYSSEEDFYDEYYDDFWDYEEAEDYYREYSD